MADKIRFLTGSLTDLENKSISRGEVYFAIDGDKGKILFDAPINQTTTKRILMGGDSEHADQAEEAKYALYDKGGKDIRTYVASISLDTPGTSLIVKNGKGDTLSTLSPKFLPLTGGKITGELYTDSLTTGDLLVNGSARFVNTILGNIETADKWKTARNFITNLGSTSKAKVDGSQAEYNIGITGILPVTNGGTGKNNGKDAANYFLNSLTTGSSNPVDNDYYISQYVNGGTTTTTFHRRPMSALWGYIKTKIKDVLILDETSYNGNAATADKWKNKSNFITNLGSTTKASVDGSQAEYNIGITGTLPIENGGTGATTAAKARENLSTLAALKPSGQSYYVMAAPDGSDNVWIRTTSQGLLPYQSGAAGSGHGNLGTSTWYFKDAYIDNIYGNAATATKLKTARKITTALNSESAGSFDGSADVTVGVSGILPVSHGGTGQNDLSKVSVGNADKLDNYHADNFKFLSHKHTSTQNANNNYIWIARLTPTGGYQGGSITINITGRYFENFNIKAHIQTGQYPYNSASIKIYIDGNKTPNTNMHAYYIKNIGTSDSDPDSYDIFINTTDWGILYYKIDNVANLKYTIKNTVQTGFDPTTATEIAYINQATEALKANKWTTARTFKVALNSTASASVDGSQDITIGVYGTLPVANGGTGATSIANIQAGKDGDGNTISSTYLKLNGGTMTGNISYKGSKGTHSMIRFIDNTTDANGNGISIGGGGSVTIGAGESSQSFTPSGGDETLYLMSDGSIKFYTYCDTIGNKRGVILDTSRNFYPDANNNGSIGTSSNKWASMYASTFYGNLSGTASYATRDSNGQIITDTYLTNVYVSDTTKLYKTIGTSGDSNKNILIGSFTPLDADGLINIKYLPQGALERMHIVANKAARLALTTANVQKGDTVYEDDTGSMYYVYDDTKLNSEDGYRLYSAGTATRVNWSGVQNRPHVVGSSSQTNVISLDAAKTTFTIRVVEKTGTESSYTLTPNFLPLAGGTMTGNITFADSTFSVNPTDAPGISWSGGTDGAKIFYRQTANNAGSLVLQVSDDGEEYIQFRHTKGGVVYLKPNTRELYPSADNSGSIGTTSYKWANMYATTFHGSLDGTANRAINDTNGKKITETYISEIKLDAAGTTIQFKAPDKTTYTEIKPKFLPLTGGTITGELYVDGGTTLASLLVNGDARFVNTIQGSISGNAGSANKWATEKAFYIADAEAKHTSSPQVNIDGSKSSYTLHLPSTIKATLEGNASSATKLTNLTTADQASSTNTWRRVWFSYDDNVNGRPSYSDTFAYQSSTGTVKATKFQGALAGNATSADKWSTARNFITNLGSESSASVDGSTGPYNLGVTGTLPVSHGGTGNTSFTALRAIYSETTTKLSSSGHYMSSSKLAINSTSEPGYHFYVNGTSYFSGVTTHGSAVNFANNTWNAVGDDVYFGDHDVVGGFGIYGKNGNTRLDFCQYNAASTYQSIIFDGNTLYASSKFGVNGSNSSYNFYVNGTSYLNGNLTVNSSGKVKIENTTDSTYSEDTNAALDIKGGVSVDKQMSAKSIRIDNNSKDKGCTLIMNLDLNCLEFVFN